MSAEQACAQDIIGVDIQVVRCRRAARHYKLRHRCLARCVHVLALRHARGPSYLIRALYTLAVAEHCTCHGERPCLIHVSGVRNKHLQVPPSAVQRCQPSE